MTIEECYNSGHMEYRCKNTGKINIVVMYDEPTNTYVCRNSVGLYTCHSKYEVEPIIKLKEKQPLFI